MTNKINEIVEQQIAAWKLNRKLANRKGDNSKKTPPPNIVTLSNERGAGGREVARELGIGLNIPVYDREIVEHIATNKHVRVSTVETLDELALGRIDDYMLDLFREKAFNQNDYAQALVHTLMLLWHQGPAILIGRGAVHVIPRQHALAVRVVASRPQRVERVRSIEHVGLQEAERIVDEADQNRKSFSQHYFAAKINDPAIYDMVLNTSFLSMKEAAALAADAYRMKFLSQPKPAHAPSDALANW